MIDGTQARSDISQVWRHNSWVLSDLAESGVEHYLKQAAAYSCSHLYIPFFLREPGYGILVAWRQGSDHYGILESLTT
jgi:hypothetical protein